MEPSGLSSHHAAKSASDYAFPVAERRVTVHCDRERPWLQHGSNSPVLDRGERKEVIDRSEDLTPEELVLYSEPEGIVDLNREGIGEAVERRIALMFMQCIVCYNMPFHFESNGADMQIGSAPKLWMKEADGKEKIVHRREAAHPSTTPCLVACSQTEWEEYIEKLETNPKAKSPHCFVYLKGSYFYSQNNSTIGMNEAVNGADELIDGRGKLRRTVVDITNLVAKGRLDPVIATLDFIKEFERACEKEVKLLKSTDPRCHVLKEYIKAISEVSLASLRPEFFTQLLGVIIDKDDPKEAILREIVFKERFKIIRFGSIVESRIAKRIDDVRAKIHGPQKYLLEFAILRDSSGRERVIIEKLLGRTAAYLEMQYLESMPIEDVETRKRVKRFQSAVTTFVSKHEDKIDKLLRDLRNDFKEMLDAERTYRSGLFRKLRIDYRDWLQPDFVKEFKKLFPGKPMSKSMVSRLEQRVRPLSGKKYITPLMQRRKDITIEGALDIADTFKVDSGLFLPSLFGSVY